jgi:hypothetical protein
MGISKNKDVGASTRYARILNPGLAISKLSLFLSRLRSTAVRQNIPFRESSILVLF